MKMGGSLSGFADLDAALVRIGGAADPTVMQGVLQPGADRLAQAARDKVRVRSGRLHDSISVSAEATAGGDAEIVVGPGSLPEAITEEFGTRREVAHPYMRSAWDEQKDAVFNDAADVMSKEIDRRAKG